MKRSFFVLKLIPLLIISATLLSSCISVTDILSENMHNNESEPNTSESANPIVEIETEPKETDPTSELIPESESKPDPDPTPEPDPTPDNPDIEPCEHSFGEWDEVTPAKCLGVPGLRERKCSSCGATEEEDILIDGHINVVDDAAVEATCKKTGLTAGSHCEACRTVIVAQIVIPIQSHTYDDDEDEVCNVCGFTRDVECKHRYTQKLSGTAATCTQSGLTEGSKCLKCGEILVSQQPITALGHSDEKIDGYAATEDEWGLTDGSKCSVCGTVLIAQKVILPTGYGNPDRYDSDYAYKSLAGLTNGSNMQRLYDAIADVAKNFHTNTSINAKKVNTSNDSYVYTVESFKLSDYGLTLEEAELVWSFFRHDHPLYYWYANNYASSSTEIYLLASEDYAKGSARAEYNALIIAAIKKYLGEIQGESSPYRIALAFHDAIITDINYAYKSDGRTPEDATWAHNILGVFEKKKGVCESYAKTFQLLLNYCEIDNVYVTGRSNGENHAWNMAKMDDGRWYWFDLTWDDSPDWMFGIKYNYFCVIDTQSVSWIDGPWLDKSNKTFSSTHTPFDLNSARLYKQYGLPSRSSTVANMEILMLRDTFTVDGYKYTIIGYNDVQLVGIQSKTNAVIPETVTYNGVTYDVVSIGAISESLLSIGSIQTSGTALKTIEIPDSITFIWDGALMIKTLTAITVDADNDVYESVDGVLFTESYYTLIQYPLGSTATSYAIPDVTVEVANMSFGTGDSGKLRALDIGRSVVTFSTMNAGYGYRDHANDGELYVSMGDFCYISSFMNYKGVITLDENNSNFVIEGGALYNGDKTSLHLLLDRNLTSFTCANTVKIIDYGAFYSCKKLKTLVLPATLTEIRKSALAYCALTDFRFMGSSAKWNSVIKASGWDFGATGCTPKCEA